MTFDFANVTNPLNVTGRCSLEWAKFIEFSFLIWVVEIIHKRLALNNPDTLLRITAIFEGEIAGTGQRTHTLTDTSSRNLTAQHVINSIYQHHLLQEPRSRALQHIQTAVGIKRSLNKQAENLLERGVINRFPKYKNPDMKVFGFFCIMILLIHLK